MARRERELCNIGAKTLSREEEEAKEWAGKALKEDQEAAEAVAAVRACERVVAELTAAVAAAKAEHKQLTSAKRVVNTRVKKAKQNWDAVRAELTSAKAALAEAQTAQEKEVDEGDIRLSLGAAFATTSWQFPSGCV